jgi:uncharacterized SAM-binding protein YcdF (DUF218 family)
MKKKIILLLSPLFIIFFLILLKLLLSFPFSPEMLIVSQEPIKADLIVIPSGEMERVEQAITLAKEGYCNKILYTGGYLDKYKKYYIDQLLTKNIEFIVVTNSVSTYTDALLTKKFIQNKDIEKIILVTSPYHSYRVYHTFSKVITDKQLISVPVKNSFFNVVEAKNNKNSFSAQSFRSEQFKYLFYFFRYLI